MSIREILFTPITPQHLKVEVTKLVRIFQKKVSHNKLFFCILLLYFVTRIVNLTLFPIFNDEAIYLNWGWIEIHRDVLYYSLFDGKQPLLMWLFGISQSIFDDPLFAGRTVSVTFGIFTLIGIYTLGCTCYSKKVARIACVFYLLIPLFIFFDRMALMESAISAIGVWLCYFVFKMIETQEIRYAVIIGFLVGLGIFIKSSAIPLVAVGMILILLRIVTRPKKSKKIIYLTLMCLSIGSLILMPLFLQKEFSNVLEMNKRYSFSLSEILESPGSTVGINLIKTGELLVWHLTPIIFLFLLYGIVHSFFKNAKTRYIALWILGLILLFIFITRNPSVRYLVSFIPITTLVAGAAVVSIFKFRKFGFIILILTLWFPVMLMFYLLTSPFTYYEIIKKYTHHSMPEYFTGWTSGYGVKDATDYILSVKSGEYTTVGVRGDSGNPEDAVYVYLREKDVRLLYINNGCARLMSGKYRMKKSSEVYFVSRGGLLGRNEECFTEIKRFYTPGGESYVGVFRFNR